ncbi:hypothetical protein A3B45_04485 [Candidatus Daviesbacteria bacterium RIFCSPLOWO2_01_FULL_39_12]|uniref:Uncharacterized protein n=1 Tax=Candidatus Daviesbacteria bacterium RIFCSPLOWO2_01_FULL_39_12 TaxID=1797785 RepID=A0A1F5KN95_9BACT|nr:MAG: hypothetical protein A3B45_04485 [Candidatus Daviesbacteria bacterium RIFCSPLOWO2_01_FULL_39_12]
MSARIVFLIILIILMSLSAAAVRAQEEATESGDVSMGIANYLIISAEDKLEDGLIVSTAQQGYSLTKTAYDSAMVGVIAQNPAVSFSLDDNPDAQPVISTGTVRVRVSTANGPIQKGDLITSSDTPGVGMKATKSGYVLGSSLDDFNSEGQSGKINVSLNIHYFNSGQQVVQSGLKDIFNLSAIATYEQPSQTLKYLVAGLLVVGSFAAGFLFFGRIASKGIDALGRNPLAGRLIQFGIFLNVLISVVIIASGVVVAYLVLRL